MAIKIGPYLPEHEPLVDAFNGRLLEGGSSWAFFRKAVPLWLAAGASPNVRRDYYLALDEDRTVRGAYCLKVEQFMLRGEPVEFASLQGPVSEGLINPKLGMLAFQLVRDMETRCSNLFAWGASDRVLQLLLRLGWQEVRMPFQLRIIKAGRFLRRNNYLRQSRRNRIALDTLAFTGVGHLGAWAAQLALSLTSGGPRTGRTHVVEADRFGPWADDVWQAALPEYPFIARRDRDTMNALLPEQGWPEAQILQVVQGSQTVGWAAVRHTAFSADKRFGSLHVGAIVDALALPGFEGAVIRAGSRWLERRGVDAVVSTFTHPVWCAAFRAAGFISRRNSRPLLLNPAATDAIGDEEVIAKGLHLTPLDGDGPQSL